MNRLSTSLRWCWVVLAILPGCEQEAGLLLPARDSAFATPDGRILVARFIHVSDSHLVDEESPARFAGAHDFLYTAWRPYEAYSTQLFDGIIRVVNRIHASGRTIDFLIHTGDACDNTQSNELAWFLGVLEGEVLDPLTGRDDRPESTRPEPTHDPHAAFEAQGLYRRGVHGDLPSIPWYVVRGNHDVHAIGVFPIFESADGHRTAPLPFDWRPGFVLPVLLDPLAAFAYGNVTPAEPGPPCFLAIPRPVEPNASRAYFTLEHYTQAVWTTVTEPAGHGFDEPGSGSSWYSRSPVPGVRMIALDTTDATSYASGGIYAEGALSRAQFAYLRAELDAARTRGELVIVVTHHPSAALSLLTGTEVAPAEFRGLLAEYPEVVLHLAGHQHRNRVLDQGSYVEIETCSTLDWPQEARLIEIWQDDEGVAIAYEMFSHLAEDWPPLGPDPLRQLREEAWLLASDSKDAAARQRPDDAPEEDAAGSRHDRVGVLLIGR